VSKIKISMTIDNDVYSAFKEYCKRNGMKISTKVELLMKDATQNTTLSKFIK
jgi:antitoxin component of RelBE/YafQ-DinJ toxin-antitoxin module